MTAPGSPRRDRAVDVVRGAALLGSAVGTALAWLGGRALGSGYRPVDGSTADRAADLLTGLLVDNRVLPVFALLLGYGLAARMLRDAPTPGDGAAAGGEHAPPDEAEWALALRRAGLLLGLGALHAALVLDADVLGTLAVLLVVAVPLVRARVRTHVAVALLVLPALLLHGALDGFGGTVGFPDPPQDYLLSVVDRVGSWLFALTLLLPAQSGLLVAVVAGARLARSGWGADPRAHRRGLLLLGGGAGAVGLLGAVPYAGVLAAAGPPDVTVALWAGVLGSVTGPAGALGAVCLGLVAATAGRRGGGPAGRALALLGRRSLVVYLAHSAVLAAVLAPWAGGAGSRWGSAAVTVLGAGLWAATLLLVLLLAPVLAPVLATVRTSVGDACPRAARTAAAAQPTERQGRARSSAT